MEEIVVTRTSALIAAEINSIKNQTRMMLLLNSIEIGRRLAEAKSLIPHGEWGKWLETNVNYSQSTANNLMRIFEEYGADQLTIFGADVKSQALGNLSYTQAVALLGVPQDEREDFIKDHDVANMSTRELQQAIKERDEARRQLEIAQKEAAAKTEEALKLLDAKQKAEADGQSLDQVLRKTQSDLKMLQETLEKERAETQKQLSKAKSSGNEAEIKRLQSALDESTRKIGELTNQLKEKPVDIPAVVEKIPEEVEKELTLLRNNQRSNAAAQKYAVYFEVVVKGFKDLLTSLEEIKELDSAVYEQYEVAVKGLLGKMAEHLD